MNDHPANWAGNLLYTPATIDEPATLDELRDLVAGATKVRALGTRHSFNDIGDTTGRLISTARLNRIVGIDHTHRTVTIEGGVRYGELGAYLYANGFALHNLASLPHISVAGACATATHGSGLRNPNLAAAVSAMDLVTANGDVISVSRARDGDRFNGMVVSLGALGIVSALTLDVEPAYDVRQDVYENIGIDDLLSSFDEVMAAGDSVSLFTDWTGDRFAQLWIKRRTRSDDTVQAAQRRFGATLAREAKHPIPSTSPIHCTPQLGVAGPWHERLPHFRLDFTPSSGDELQSEYFVPLAYAPEALRALMRVGDRIAPHLLVSEVRTVAADSLWMSPCYDTPCLALHFTWQPRWNDVQRALADVEAALSPFEPRPHWGKLFLMSLPAHPRRNDFRALMRVLDPAGKFTNAFIERHLSS